MTPTSVAVTPAEPTALQYPIEALALYEVFDRASYEKKFGIQPPDYDPAKPLKNWFATDGINFATLFNHKTMKIEGPLLLTAAEAAAVNVIGAYRYPAFVPPATVGSYDFEGTVVTINPSFISRKIDVDALVAKLSLDLETTTITISESSQFPGALSFTGEEGRVYEVKVLGTTYNAESLIRIWYAHGVGAPGKFTSRTLGTADGLVFSPAPAASVPPGGSPPECPLPIRPLNADEKFVPVSPFLWYVTREQPSSPSGSAPGQYTQADRDRDRQTNAMLQILLQKLGIRVH